MNRNRSSCRRHIILRLRRLALDGRRGGWLEVQITGLCPDGTAHEMAGVIVFGVRDWGAFLGLVDLEPCRPEGLTSTRRCAAGPGRRRVRAGARPRLQAMIVVAGGTGTLGTRLVPRLAGQGLAVRVLTRDRARAQRLAGLERGGGRR